MQEEITYLHAKLKGAKHSKNEIIYFLAIYSEAIFFSAASNG